MLTWGCQFLDWFLAPKNWGLALQRLGDFLYWSSSSFSKFGPFPIFGPNLTPEPNLTWSSYEGGFQLSGGMPFTPSELLGKKWDQKLHFLPWLSQRFKLCCPTLAQVKTKPLQGQMQKENDVHDPHTSLTHALVLFLGISRTHYFDQQFQIEFLVPNLATKIYLFEWEKKLAE